MYLGVSVKNSEEVKESKSKKRPQTVNAANKIHEEPIEKESGNKILITGDDVLIEYVNRIVNGLKKLISADNNYDIDRVIELFIGYYVWNTPDIKRNKPNATMWQRLDSRLQEMRDRRKRLVKSVYK
jgi:hypothetical protein